MAGENGIMSLWDRKELENNTKDIIVHKKNIKVENRGSIASISTHSNGQNMLLAIGYRTNFISIVNLDNILKSENKKLQRVVMENSYHLGYIEEKPDPNHISFTTMDMDIAIHRPLIVTSCKSDSTIRIWNYLTFKCELVRCLTLKRYNNTQEAIRPLSISFHPSGYLLAGGFNNQAIIWNVLIDDIRPYYVFANYKYCSKVRFSNSGHLLAIAQMLTSNKVVFIHNCYNLKQVCTIKIPSTAVISEITFSSDDLLVALCCTDGFLIVYNIQTKKETLVHSSRRCIYFGCKILGPEDVIVYGSDENKRGIVRHVIKDDVVKAVKLQSTRLMSGLFLPNGNLAVGTEDGIIKVLENSGSYNSCFEINMHVGAIGRFLMSPEGGFAFTCGEDGVLFIYGVGMSNLPIDSLIKTNRKEGLTITATEGLADIVLIEREKLLKDKTSLDSLMDKVQDMESTRKVMENQLHVQYKAQLEEMKEDKVKAIEDMQSRIDSIKEELTKREKQYTTLINSIEEKHLGAVADLEVVFKTKLDAERKKYIVLEQGMKDDIRKLQNIVNSKEKERVKEMLYDNEKNNKELERLSKKLNDIKLSQEEIEGRIEEKMKLQNEEHGKEMDLREKMIGKEIIELKNIIKVKEEEFKRNDTKIKELIDEKRELQHKVKDLTMMENQLHGQILKLENDLERLSKDRSEAIEETKALKTSLFKSKCKQKTTIKECQVLRWTTKDLKDKLIPITEESTQLNDRIKEIESEYAEYIEIMSQQKSAQEKQINIIKSQHEKIIDRGDNSWKRLPIPHKTTVQHGTVIKGFIR